MKHKSYSFLCCTILFFLTSTASSQTYFTPHIGFTLHSIQPEPYPTDEYFSYDKLNNKFAYGVGASLRHYILPGWSVNHRSTFYLNEQDYTMHSFGFVPRTDYTYNLASFDFETAIDIYNGIEFGIGYSRIMFFNRSKILIFRYSDEMPNLGVNAYYLNLNYNYRNFVFNISYANSFGNSKQSNIQMVSASIGYALKLRDARNSGRNVDCP